MDEDRGLVFGQDEVGGGEAIPLLRWLRAGPPSLRLSAARGWGLTHRDFDMEAETVTHFVEQGADDFFRRRILAANARHVPRTAGFRQAVFIHRPQSNSEGVKRRRFVAQIGALLSPSARSIAGDSALRFGAEPAEPTARLISCRHGGAKSIVKTMSKTSPQLAEESLAAERRAFERQRAQLMRRYPSEYVALSGGRVVDHDKQDEALAARMFTRFGDAVFYIARLEQSPTVYEVPSRRA